MKLDKFILVIITIAVLFACKKDDDHQPGGSNKDDFNIPQVNTLYRIDSIHVNWPYLGWKKDTNFESQYLTILSEYEGFYHSITGESGSSYLSDNVKVTVFRKSADSLRFKQAFKQEELLEIIEDGEKEIWQNNKIRYFIRKENYKFLDKPIRYTVDSLITRGYNWISDGHAGGYWEAWTYISKPKNEYIIVGHNQWAFLVKENGKVQFIDKIEIFTDQVLIKQDYDSTTKFYHRSFNNVGTESWKSIYQKYAGVLGFYKYELVLTSK